MIEQARWPQPVVNSNRTIIEAWQPRRPLFLVAIFGALLLHGGLALYGSYANTYDAYIHMFFADHWLQSWFDHWEPRWYTGFTMTSYPPLSHQSVALLARLTGDLRTAFVLVQTGAMAFLTFGMVRFARLWVDDEAAQWAAIWLMLSSHIAETIHVFGQLPTIVSLGLLLNALPYIYRWINGGRQHNLWSGWALIAATTGAHHVTTLFGVVFIMAPVVLLALLQHLHSPRPDEAPGPRYWTQQSWRALSAQYLRRIGGPLLRTTLFGVGAVALLLLIVWPYWVWTMSDPISQVPIPHASRDNFFVNLNAGLIFWLIPYGMLLVIMPYTLIKGFGKRMWPLTASIALLALLGTGGTPPAAPAARRGLRYPHPGPLYALGVDPYVAASGALYHQPQSRQRGPLATEPLWPRNLAQCPIGAHRWPGGPLYLYRESAPVPALSAGAD